MDGCIDVMGRWTLGNRMDVKKGIDNDPCIENEDVVMATTNAIDLEMSGIGEVMEISPWIPRNEGMGC